VPDRARQALEFETYVKEWGIKPWELDKLTASDLQEIRLAEHTESYIQQEQQNQRKRQQQGKRGRRSARNSERYQDYQDRMQDRYGGLN